MKRWLVPAVWLLLSSIPFPAQTAEVDSYGGWTLVQGTKTGFFHTEKIDGRWWLVTPDGNAFFSKGVCHISFEGDHSPKLGYYPYEKAVQAKYGSEGKWAEATALRLKEWNFNTVSAWSSSSMFETGLAYTVILDLGASIDEDLWLMGGFPDVFSEDFRKSLDRVAREKCQPFRGNPWLLGYFTDNELRWGPDWRSRESLLETFLKMPEESAGRKKARAFMKEKKRLPELPTDQDKLDFLEIVAGEYFRQCRQSIRRYDPDHLILGCRFGGYVLQPVLVAMRSYVDLVSYNDYAQEPPLEKLRSISSTTGKPVMITEFSFKALDSGLPNTRGAGKALQTQTERAERFAHYVQGLASLPECVGFHWFQFSDQPAEGRFDGENSNYGLVKGDDSSWDLLTNTMKEVNQGLESLAIRAKEK
jgi:hypothetical protein